VSYSAITPGQSLAITWSATDGKGIAGVDIDYSTDTGKSWKVITSNQGKSGTFNWTVPSITATTITLRVKAKDTSGNIATASKVCFIRAASTGSTGKSDSGVKSLIVLEPGGTKPALPVTVTPTLTFPPYSGSTGITKSDFSGYFF
jgi:hypothetical protein